MSDGWARNVAVEINPNGDFIAVQRLKPGNHNEYQTVAGCVVPGMPNCHSHAHQRAMAGLGEKAAWDGDTNGKSEGKAIDSFYTWRTAMYHYLEHIQPQHLYAIAQQLYMEMLKAGYTHVGEFQYLHHDQKGTAYANKAEMTLQCMQAASDLGIGFTALPVLYRYGGLGGQVPLVGQKRFLNDVEGFCDIVQSLLAAVKKSEHHNCAVGIAPHSLRAITESLLNEVIDALPKKQLAAIHIHIAEQSSEVDDCLAWCGERPLEWLFNRFDVDQQWCLIHATHLNEQETTRFAQSAAVAGLCPTTEANLGDGFFNLSDYVNQGGVWAIGSDSHISISPVEELRWLEYAQRLLYKQRNVMANKRNLNTGMALYCSALAGGRQSSGAKIARIAAGQRADFIVLDSQHPRLYRRADEILMDSWLFSGNENLVQDVYVGGCKVIDCGRHINQEKITHSFKRAIDELAQS